MSKMHDEKCFTREKSCSNIIPDFYIAMLNQNRFIFLFLRRKFMSKVFFLKLNLVLS